MPTNAIRSLISQLQSRDPRGSAQRLRMARESLKHRNGFVRRVALESLTALRPRGLKGVLVEALSDRSWDVRIAALEGLESILPLHQRGPKQVIRLLRDPNHLVRLQAAEVIGVIGDRAGLPKLRASLRDRSPLVRRYVAEAIGRVGKAADRGVLERRLRTERSTSARLGLYHGLYLLGVRDVLPKLTSMLADSDYLVRSATAVSLGDTGRYPLDAREATNAIRDAMERETSPARESMREALVTLDSVGL